MIGFRYVNEFLPKIIRYKLARANLVKMPMPIVLTYSVTNMCQSRCKTCNIWKFYGKKPGLRKEELTIDEIEKTFRSMGHIYFFNISGGEPFLRKDLVEIVKLACRYLRPKIIHIPTNGIAPELIEKQTERIMRVIDKDIQFTIKPSFDAVGKKHDKIRGVRGNFKKVLETIDRLKKLQKNYPNLHVGVGTVISRFNVDLGVIKEVSAYVRRLDVDSYINEIAEQRSELFNLNNEITPKVEDYQKAINYFSEQIRADLRSKRKLTRLTQAFRLVYYNLVVRILEEKRQIIPCYAAISNVHINPYGEVWPCCILGYERPIGDLRKNDYDFKKIWCSRKARRIRDYIKNKECYCPLANQAYSNMLCNFKIMIGVIKNIFY